MERAAPSEGPKEQQRTMNCLAIDDSFQAQCDAPLNGSLWNMLFESDDETGIEDALATNNNKSEDRNSVVEHDYFCPNFSDYLNTSLDENDLSKMCWVDQAKVESPSRIVRHDCMWAGHCGSKQHSDVAKRPILTPFSSPKSPASAAKSQVTIAGSSRGAARSIVKPSVVPSPDSPPMSDDEEVRKKLPSTLQMLQETISECDLDEDSDLCEYFDEDEFLADAPASVGYDLEDDDEDEEEEDDDDDDEEQTSARYRQQQQQQQQPQPQQAKTMQRRPAPEFNDHSYHKERSTNYVKMTSLGVETPSDSGKLHLTLSSSSICV